jgi:flagellar biosynthesis/type III secretory pathway M-ring protein FliF/YscJ
MIEEAFDANLESILHLSKSKPETVAALIKSWIAEES